MRRSSLLVLFSVAAASIAVAAACRTTADLPFGNASPTPSGTLTSTPTPTVSPTPTITPNVDQPPLHVPMATAVPASPCMQVTRADVGNEVRVSDASPFHLHDEVLLLQIQTAVGNAPALDAPSQTGPLTLAALPANFGFHQFALVVQTNGTTLTLSTAHGVALSTVMTTPIGAAELCRVPVYDSVTIDAGGELDASPWNGTSGGVITFDTTNFTEDGFVNAVGAGFRGGAVGRANSMCSNTSTTDPDGGLKGEGNDPRWYDTGSTFTSGRGVEGLGGGGGDVCGAGAGGGGNGGVGGTGAKDQINTINFGLGGLSVAADGALAPTFGGGGGGGADTGNGAGPGGVGGGVVWIRVRGTFSGGGNIFADGASPTKINGSDGLGGGGAGGTAVIEMLAGSSSTFAGNITADAGDGGGTTSSAATVRSGGGGAGGRVSGPSGAFYSARGGSPGLNGSGSIVGNATSGAAGLVPP